MKTYNVTIQTKLTFVVLGLDISVAFIPFSVSKLLSRLEPSLASFSVITLKNEWSFTDIR